MYEWLPSVLVRCGWRGGGGSFVHECQGGLELDYSFSCSDIYQRYSVMGYCIIS